MGGFLELRCRGNGWNKQRKSSAIGPANRHRRIDQSKNGFIRVHLSKIIGLEKRDRVKFSSEESKRSTFSRVNGKYR